VGERGGRCCGGRPLAAALEFELAAGRQGAVLHAEAAGGGYRVPTSATNRVRLHEGRRRVLFSP
jgi:hypothetical protein